MENYKRYSNDEVIKYAAEVVSMAQLLNKLGLRMAGGNYNNMRRLLQKLNVNCNHWVGQAWNKGQRLKDWSNYTKSKSAKNHLIKEKGHKCESCGLSEWMGLPIVLEIEHVDGNRTNNEISNLKLLCCNCHAMTPTWRNKKRHDSKCPSEKNYKLS